MNTNFTFQICINHPEAEPHERFMFFTTATVTLEETQNIYKNRSLNAPPGSSFKVAALRASFGTAFVKNPKFHQKSDFVQKSEIFRKFYFILQKFKMLNFSFKEETNLAISSPADDITFGSRDIAM